MKQLLPSLLLLLGCSAAPSPPPPGEARGAVLEIGTAAIWYEVEAEGEPGRGDPDLAEGVAAALSRHLEAEGLKGLHEAARETRPIDITRVVELRPGETPARRGGEDGAFLLTVRRVPFVREGGAPFNLVVTVVAIPSAGERLAYPVLERELRPNALVLGDALLRHDLDEHTADGGLRVRVR